jgi:hypothetical protein
MEFEELVKSQSRPPSNVDPDDSLNLSGKRNAQSATAPWRVAGAASLTMAAGGANIEVALPPLQVRLVADKGNSIAQPLKKLAIVASAKDFFCLVEDVINPEHKLFFTFVVFIGGL